jgi:hypothetical protein
MRDVAPGPAPGLPGPIATRGRRPPAWGIVLFLLLLAGFLFINYRASVGGPPVAWIDNDLSAALKQAAEQKRKVFLYLYDPADPTAARNERQVFTQHWARKPLEKVVCCRVVMRPGDPLAAKYVYKNQPVFLLLDAQGNVLSRTEGAVDESQFFTYIGDIADRSR